MSELLRTGRMNEMGRFEDGCRRVTLDRASRTFFSWRATSTSWPRPRARTSPGCRWSAVNSASTFDDIDVFYLAGGFGRHLKVDAARRIGLIPNLPDRKSSRSAMPPSKGRASRCLSKIEARGIGGAGQARRALPPRNAPAVFRFLRGRLPVQAGGNSLSRSSRDRARRHLARCERSAGRIQAAARVLRADCVMTGRARELAEMRAPWYAEHGRPWVYARRRRALEHSTVRRSAIDGVPFHAARR